MAELADILARLSLYLLTDSHPSYSALLKGLFDPQNIPNTLLVVLLNWETPWTWMRQLCNWIRVLRHVLNQLDNPSKDAMDENMKEWTEERKGPNPEGLSSSSITGTNHGNASIPLASGSWDEALGLPLCVVCQNAEKIESLEREHGWKDDEFDFILQHLRTVLLKHGASLIYTATSRPGSLETLIRSSLDIHSLLQRNPLKYNVVDRDKILIPPNWDSWAKIRHLKEEFDVESVSAAWSVEIQARPEITTTTSPKSTTQPGSPSPTAEDSRTPNKPQPSIVSNYERVIQDPNVHRPNALRLGSSSTVANLNSTSKPGIDTHCQDTQEFLAGQLTVLERLKVEDEAAQRAKDAAAPRKPGSVGVPSASASVKDAPGFASKVNEHIGPVQFNMGGIQVDADDALKSLKERGADSGTVSARALSPSPEISSRPFSPVPSVGTPKTGEEGKEGEEKIDSDKLALFFAGLMSRSGGSAANSPGPGQKEVK